MSMADFSGIGIIFAVGIVNMDVLLVTRIFYANYYANDYDRADWHYCNWF
jgi:hypothetical protein